MSVSESRRGSAWEGALSGLDRERPPSGQTLFNWLWEGVRENPAAVLAALLLTWGGLSTVLFLAAWGAVAGGVFGLYGATALRLAALSGGVLSSGSSELFGFLGPTVTAVGPLAGALAGAVAAPAYVYGSGLATPGAFVLGLVSSLFPGILIGGALLVGLVAFERPILWLRGARRLSRRERERVEPLVEEIAQLYRVGQKRPTLLAYDDDEPQAYAHARHVVVTGGLLELLTDEELAGVLAHELHHWRRGHALGSVAVWAAAWPLLIVYNLAVWVSRFMPPLIVIIVWLITWHVFLSVRYIVAPLQGLKSRHQEYEADAAASGIGHGDGLYRALEQMRELEPGRSGWQKALAQTHPPAELRLEAIEDREDLDDREAEGSAGGGLIELCPECEEQVSADQRYCNQCGHELAPAARG